MTRSKYGDLIRKAREPKNQETREQENQTKESERLYTSKPAEQVVVKPENQQAKKPENQQEREQEREVNLCVKVPESLRRHWAAESKREGVTMTEIIVQALSDRFGKPSPTK